MSNLEQIQKLGQEKQQKEQELGQMTMAAQALCDVVYPTKDERSLLQRLIDAPACMAGYASGTAKVVLAHGLALVKSYVPTVDMQPLTDGISENCSEERFHAYVEEVRGGCQPNSRGLAHLSAAVSCL